MNERCDRSWEIDALREERLSAKDAESFGRHVASCASCAALRERNERLRDLAEKLPKTEPTDLELRRLRSRLLRDVELEPPVAHAWRKRATLAAVAALCVVGAFAIRHRHAAPLAPSTVAIASPSASSTDEPLTTFAGSVVPTSGASWSQTRQNGIEHVRLDDGILSLHVRHQTAYERFFVDLPDGQIEVHGTTFRVEVHDGVTSRVDVSEGVVAVRIHGKAEITVLGGASWSIANDAASSAHVASIPTPMTTHGQAHTNGSSPSVDDRAADDYASAVALLRNGSYDGAATALASFLAAHPNAPQAEDASYLEATALARAGRSDAAALAAEHHLAAYPRSFHAKEASILVARAARDRGDCNRARAALAPWLGENPDAEAVATLRSCAAP